jgi:hypothetical protein
MIEPLRPVPQRPPPLPDARRAIPVGWVVAGCALLLTGAAVLYAFNPTEAHFFPPCPFHKLTGLYCPGCGSTRAMHQLLHGHVAAAFDFNPLVVVMLPFVAFAVARQAWQFSRRQRAPSWHMPAWSLWALVAVVLVFGVARNLPWGPVRWMAP